MKKYKVKSYGPPVRVKVNYAFMFTTDDPVDTVVVIVEHEDIDEACVKALMQINWSEDDARGVVFDQRADVIGGAIYSKQVDVDKTSESILVLGNWDHYLTFE